VFSGLAFVDIFAFATLAADHTIAKVAGITSALIITYLVCTRCIRRTYVSLGTLVNVTALVSISRKAGVTETLE